MKQNKKKRNLIISVCLIAALLVAGVLAYLIATDSKTNVFTVGKVKAELWEGFDSNVDGSIDVGPEFLSDESKSGYITENNGKNDELYGPDDDEELTLVNGKSVVPTQKLLKQPFVVNTGKNTSYVYAKVGIPKDYVVTVDENGRLANDGSSKSELFTLNDIGEGWVLLSEDKPYEEDESYNYYLYAYANDAALTTLKPLEAGKSTTRIFDSVSFANVANIPVSHTQTIINEGETFYFNVSDYMHYSTELANYMTKTNQFTDEYAIRQDKVGYGMNESFIKMGDALDPSILSEIRMNVRNQSDDFSQRGSYDIEPVVTNGDVADILTYTNSNGKSYVLVNVKEKVDIESLVIDNNLDFFPETYGYSTTDHRNYYKDSNLKSTFTGENSILTPGIYMYQQTALFYGTVNPESNSLSLPYINYFTNIDVEETIVLKDTYSIPIDIFTIQSDLTVPMNPKKIFEEEILPEYKEGGSEEESTESGGEEEPTEPGGPHTPDEPDGPTEEPIDNYFSASTADWTSGYGKVIMSKTDLPFAYAHPFLADAKEIGYKCINGTVYYADLENLIISSGNVEASKINGAPFEKILNKSGKELLDSGKADYKYDTSSDLYGYINITPEDIDISAINGMPAGEFDIPWILSVARDWGYSNTDVRFGNITKPFSPGLYVLYYIDQNDIIHTISLGWNDSAIEIGEEDEDRGPLSFKYKNDTAPINISEWSDDTINSFKSTIYKAAETFNPGESCKTFVDDMDEYDLDIYYQSEASASLVGQYDVSVAPIGLPDNMKFYVNEDMGLYALEHSVNNEPVSYEIGMFMAMEDYDNSGEFIETCGQASFYSVKIEDETLVYIVYPDGILATQAMFIIDADNAAEMLPMLDSSGTTINDVIISGTAGWKFREYIPNAVYYVEDGGAD